MKKIAHKFIISIVALAIVFVAIYFINKNDQTKDEGQIHLIIENEEGFIVFESDLIFYQNESFFDILERHFQITCANHLYQQDTSCSYSFSILGVSNRVLLGIKNDDFELMTDFNQTFIQIEILGSLGYYPATQGVDNLKFEDGSSIKLVSKRVSLYG